jgi:N-acyl-D-aspartate/D-glutamate deacylase
MDATFDMVVRGGTVVDGSGRELVEADIAMADGRIREVGRVAGKGREEIDARGKLVTPGFVDIHTHYDGQAMWSNRLMPSSNHGITSVVAGNCGVGFAPCRPEDRTLLVDVMAGVEDIPELVMANGLPWDWETFPEFLDAVERRSFDMDVSFFLAHSPLRVYVMGQRGANREMATEDDLVQMRRLTCEAMHAGAMGFATSRTIGHRSGAGNQIPSFEASALELQSAALGMKDAGQGIFQLVPNSGPVPMADEITLMERISSVSGRPVSFSFAQLNNGGNEWENTLSHLESANKRPGISIKGQVMPRPIGLLMSLDSSMNPFSCCPSYERLNNLSLQDRTAEMRKPETRQRLLGEQPTDATNILYALSRHYERIFLLGDPPDYEPPQSASIEAMARRRGISPDELAYDLLVGDAGGGVLFHAASNYPTYNLDGIHAMLRHEDTVVGIGDGGAHYGLICDASYSTFLLSYWTRDRRGDRLSIADAVKALTRDTSRSVGLNDRGLIAVGQKADLNVIDYNNLSVGLPRVTRDLPGGGKRFTQTAEGYFATIVSGQVTYRNGQPTAALPGRLVRGPQNAPV